MISVNCLVSWGVASYDRYFMAFRRDIAQAVSFWFFHNPFCYWSTLVRYHNINIMIHVALRNDLLLLIKRLLRRILVLWIHTWVPLATHCTPTSSLTSNAINKAIQFIRALPLLRRIKKSVFSLARFLKCLLKWIDYFVLRSDYMLARLLLLYIYYRMLSGVKLSFLNVSIHLEFSWAHLQDKVASFCYFLVTAAIL